MNAIKELRNTTNMSQNKFAAYLGIPVANIQHWEQGVTSPPNYLISLISRVMVYDGYIKKELTPADVDIIRQTRATLALEEFDLEAQDLSKISELLLGEVTREEFQRRLKEKYQVNDR